MRDETEQTDFYTQLKEKVISSGVSPHRVFVVSESKDELMYIEKVPGGPPVISQHLCTELVLSEGIRGRGDFLNKVFLIELLLLQIIFISMNEKEHIDFFDETLNVRWNGLLFEFPIAKKIKFLNRFKLLKKKTIIKLEKIRGVRNKMAHILHENYIRVNGVTWQEGREFLGNEVNMCWSELLEAYTELWDPGDMAKCILDQLERFQKSGKAKVCTHKHDVRAIECCGCRGFS